ncbi:type II/IV secretion system protein [Candidatus Uhrbacteria bacterium]|nr:type II/IV secretion system protein [Candidatus Uhrbacteria bacterium]
MKKKQEKKESTVKDEKVSGITDAKIAYGTDAWLKDILMANHYVSADDMASAENFSQKNTIPLARALVQKEFVTRDIIGQAIAESLNIPYADLNSHPAQKEHVLEIPEEKARALRAVIFKKQDTELVITTDTPWLANIQTELKKLFPGKKIILAYSLTEDIDAAFLYYRHVLQTRFNEIIQAQKRIVPEILEQIFEDALSFRASDIHFEPQEKETLIRFRIDGVLQEAGRVSKEYYGNILNRLKVQARIRTDEHASAQDGAIRYTQKDGTHVDMRMSIAPILDGEKVVIRLLAKYVQDLTLAHLGLSQKHYDLLINASKKPFGMIIVAGPTGSGKTTTLYSLIKLLHRPEINITTLEDPVEYKITGINQIQVNPQTNLTYAKGLRSIVRQDPNIILVGEIRDEETAEIAVNAALTGHLLFSTFHANDAATAIPRLLDMSVEPFLLSSTLELIISQRLIRKICEHCRVSTKMPRKEIEKMINAEGYFQETTITLYKGKKCELCNGSGYKGRTAIFEFIHATPELQDLVLKHPSMQQIRALAHRQGSLPMFEDGIEKVKQGITTIEELLRVAVPPQKM